MSLIGVLTTEQADRVRDAGGEPLEFDLPEARPDGGVALVREWVADTIEVLLGAESPDALLIEADSPGELVGLFLAALRLDLPTVVARRDDAYTAALTALGVVPLKGDAAATAVEIAANREPRIGELVGNFSLANALRTGLSMGGGSELMVHFSAIAREGDVSGFSQMLRVLTPETPEVAPPDSKWFQEQGTERLFAHLDDDLHDVPTVTGWLKDSLPAAPPPPEESFRLVFVEGKASRAEAICRAPVGTEEVAGECRIFLSEEEAAQAARDGDIETGNLVVVGGYGPRGGPGLLKLEELGAALDEAGLAESVPVVTDGLPPDGASGTWISLMTREAAAGGMIGRLRDGDVLRMDLQEGRIRAGMKPSEMRTREPYEATDNLDAGYAGRYARSARNTFDGAGFG
ncbi:MAG: dihydroxy-acid dehydratase [Rubrobacteraceae bacterium]